MELSPHPNDIRVRSLHMSVPWQVAIPIVKDDFLAEVVIRDVRNWFFQKPPLKRVGDRGHQEVDIPDWVHGVALFGSQSYHLTLNLAQRAGKTEGRAKTPADHSTRRMFTSTI